MNMGVSIEQCNNSDDVQSAVEYRVVFSCALLLFRYFIFITSLSSPSQLLHCFNNHSHIHDKFVLIAGATLLHCFNLHCLFISRLTNTKVSYTVPPFRHIVCRLRIHITLASFSTDTPRHNHVLCSY